METGNKNGNMNKVKVSMKKGLKLLNWNENWKQEQEHEQG